MSVNFKLTSISSFGFFRWIFLCMDSWEDHLNPFAHRLHLYGRRSSCVFTCSSKFCLDPNLAPQYEHMCFRTFKWVTSTCRIRLYLVENIFYHEDSAHTKPGSMLIMIKLIIRILRILDKFPRFAFLTNSLQFICDMPIKPHWVIWIFSKRWFSRFKIPYWYIIH